MNYSHHVGNIHVWAINKKFRIAPGGEWKGAFALSAEEARQMAIRLFEKSLTKEEAREVSQSLMSALRTSLDVEDGEEFYVSEKTLSSLKEEDK